MGACFDTRRWTTGILLAAFATAALSPAAEAAHRRYKDVGNSCPPPASYGHYAPRRVVYVERHSDAAPLFAGLIGGLVLGSVLAQNSAPVHAVAPAYYYWDPYSHVRYEALPVYDSRYCYHEHPRVLRVISVATGDCMGTYHWYRGDWHARDWDED
jgi:hypothetical protein